MGKAPLLRVPPLRAK